MHNLLKRQLKRLELNSESLSVSDQVWQQFLAVISKTYDENDKERYLNERSMALSSKEMMELNEKLIRAQNIARLGYWSYDKQSDFLFLSNEIYNFLYEGLTTNVSSLTEFLGWVELKDREKITTAIEKLFVDGKAFDIQFRIIHPNKDLPIWCQMVAHRQNIEEDKQKISGIIMDITKRKTYEAEILALHDQLLVSARMAGMSEIAVSVLHNVGNVLNSANVSIGVIQENVDEIELEKFQTVLNLIEENKENLADYLTNDEVGNCVPEYLRLTSNKIESKIKDIKDEIGTLNESIKHVVEIITTQQQLNKRAEFTEIVDLTDIVDMALKVSGCLDKNYISVEKNYQFSPKMKLDKTKLIEILVNLLKNAKDAMEENQEVSDNLIKVFVDEGSEEGTVRISVSDNGIGVPEQNSIKIFSFNFTTKKNGNGIGLHNSANLAKEMGGKLVLDSSVVGKETTFSLFLPLKREESSMEINGNGKIS